MLEALWMWRQFPRQIASDLLTLPGGRHIKHWLRGTRGSDGDLILSSYELLLILENLPETSAFKSQAERGGRWIPRQQMLAELVNESYRFRSSFQAANSENAEAGFDTADIEFVDPVVRAENDKAAAAKDAADGQAQNTFEHKMGYYG